MNRVLASLAAGLTATVLALPSPAAADFFIKKTKPKAAAPKTPAATTPRPAASQRRTRPVDTARAPAPPPTPTAGIDLALMQQTIVEARYTANLTRNPAEKTASLQVTNGKSGWSVNFKNCFSDSQCGTMEFYTLWRVSNEANVCSVWSNDIIRDPARTQGKPYCYIVPDLTRQFHLKLSSDQSPYTGFARLSPQEAKDRMRTMIGVWTSALDQLPQAWDIASGRCPRISDRCTQAARDAAPPQQQPAKRTRNY